MTVLGAGWPTAPTPSWFRRPRPTCRFPEALCPPGQGRDSRSLYAASRHNATTRRRRSTYERGHRRFVTAARSSRPYSFEERALEAGGDLRLTRTQRLSAEVEQVAQERTLQEVEKTIETRAKLGWRGRPGKTVETRLSLGHAERAGDAYEPVDTTAPAQNPLLSKFNLADRRRSTVGASGSVTPAERLRPA